LLLAHASLWLADVVGARTLLAQASRLARRTPDAAIFRHWFDDAWSYMDTLAETTLAGPSSLTIAELRVLRFLPSHRSFREIAEQLGVSANTVKTQAHAVYRKLGAASRSEAVSRARAAGLLGQ
jgi:LuxR family maltose regulon positive regulatory protein